MSEIRNDAVSAKQDHCASRGGKAIVTVACLLMAIVAVWVGLKARNAAREYRFIGVPIERNTITVSGEGRATSIPDIAQIEIGTAIERGTVAEAQGENTRIMNSIDVKLRELGVDKADVQTSNYSISPMYDWNEGRQSLRGYQVAQSLRVKVRNLDSIGEILGAAGELGANQVGGIEFTLDEPESVRQEARVEALKNAKSKAEALSEVVGVKLRRVVSFSESAYEPLYNIQYAARDMVLGMGGSESAPTVQPGSAEYVLTANVTYEIE
ncbi:SIMPL domain-containing protein [Candidatus Uhrbacteria bacterium]|nr:SIMPL domain-containing protein [Candidatus Uhrbacteria bacterium]